MCGTSTINKWDIELKEMNNVGTEPLQYPNTFLLLLGYAKAYFIYHIGKPKRALLKDMLKGKYLPSMILQQ
jgi:hypothetical protein